MADPHGHHDHGHDHAEPAQGSWFTTFVLSLGMFLAIWLSVLYVGHTLASKVSD
jgi:hypothetical protein